MNIPILILALLISNPLWAKKAQKTPIEDTSELTAKSWLIADADNKILAFKDIETVRPIASITKVMTVLTIMEAKQDLGQYLAYQKNQFFTREELIGMAMVRSDNRAAEVLCKNYIGGYGNCIGDMNANAIKYGMKNTNYVDATGLLPDNTSTAEDLLTLLTIAEKNYLINYAATKTKVEIKIRKKWYIFKQTNPLIGHKHKFIVSKTGTTMAAGGCIILTVETERGLRRVIILGSKDGRTRIPEAEFIYKTVD